MAMPPEIRRTFRAGLQKMQEELAKEEEVDSSIFKVKPITNGFLVEYNDVEEYDVRVPHYEAFDPTKPRPALGSPLKMVTERRWRFKQATVFCADAGSIKKQIDHALDLERKVKELIAQGILTEGDGTTQTDLAVGA